MQLTAIICGVAIVLQTAELCLAKSFWQKGGIWQGRSDGAANPVSQLLKNFLISDRSFQILLALRMVSALCLIGVGALEIQFSFLILLASLLMMTTLLIALRFRGPLSGASDSMEIFILLGLLFGSWSLRTGLALIAVQLTISYVRAGFAKLIQPAWRTGTAVPFFLTATSYQVPQRCLVKAARWNIPAAQSRFRWAAWLIVLFEILFPFSWLGPHWALGFLGCGAAFHLVNVYLFGLNRFLFIWLAAYPALYAMARLNL